MAIHSAVEQYDKWLATLAVAIFASSVADLFAKRVITYSIAIIFTGLFFLIISSNDLILTIQTTVVLCALMMGFIWRGEKTSAYAFSIFSKACSLHSFSPSLSLLDYYLFTQLSIIYCLRLIHM